jgi:uncharacterized iron-regulated membrane protein
MAMRRLALQGSVRRLFTRLHRWSGLTLLVVLFIAAATGSVLPFREQIERWINPHLHVVPAGAQRVPLQEVIDIVERRHPDARVSTITLRSETADASLIVYLAKRPGAPPGDLEASEAFVNPYTGTLLGERNRRHPVFSRENVVPMLIRLHYSLLLESPGVWLMGTAAMVWLLTSVIGLALAWPTSSRRAVSWRPIVTVRRAGGSYKLTYDLHRALGVALLPVWLVLGFTSVYLNFPGIVRTATMAVAAVTAPPTRAAAGVERPAVTPDQAIAKALARVQAAKPFGVTRDFTRSWYAVRLVAPGDVSPTGNSQVYVDFSTGEVVAVRLASELRAGDRFIFWQFPLHSGEAFGLPGRVAVAVAATALMVMCGTGLYVWWRGWSVRASAKSVRRERHAEARNDWIADARHPDGDDVGAGGVGAGHAHGNRE